MLDTAMKAHPESFKSFDRTKNVQDQLQEMVLGKWLHINVAFNGADIYSAYKDGVSLGDFSTWEQLWLAFVMKEKFGKVWSNDKWEGVCPHVIDNHDFKEGGW